MQYFVGALTDIECVKKTWGGNEEGSYGVLSITQLLPFGLKHVRRCNPGQRLRSLGMRFSFIKDSVGHTQTSMKLFLEFMVKLAALM